MKPLLEFSFTRYDEYNQKLREEVEAMPKCEREQIQFLISLIKKDIQHYEGQQETVKKWIKQSILSLNKPDICHLEELRNEYKQNALEQSSLLREFQQTLKLYENMWKKA